ncbi:ubiquitin-specific protease UBP1 [Aspergillus saccharolyticus JOP 1030-1]|uniref:ubiquitinyl hydrolase 1 n=1 Tax=Aspergillus saccharolyticus JOP 1030-1 TaxID=1450539 RepID=A0A319AD89_9EURO|nr:ubiquitin-specific protease [Aspergillus saccharolyticus JOP 1030-1]PYH49548.1 ubiquitin-specific protease [Aspergillus saccharolyticus JOP 1030-1]
MNARREGIDFSTQSSFSSVPYSNYDPALQRLQDHPNFTASVLVTVSSVYLILNYLGLLPFSLARIVWNLVVRLTPSRLVAALDATQPDSADSSLSSSSSSMSFEAKSEAMRRILGLDNGFLSALLPHASTFPGFSTSLLSGKDNLPPGLGNWDNSCYQNSIIQGLASLHSLEDFLDKNLEDLGQRSSFSTHQALKEIIERLNSAESYGQRLWTPPDLKSMSSWQQQDAQEYFAKMVDQLDLEVRQATRRQTRNLGLKMAGPQEHVIGTDEGSPLVQVERTRDLRSATEPQLVENPLEGLLAQRVGCIQCGWTEGLSLIPFNCLTVPLGPKFEYDIRECLHQYMHLEPIEGVECAKCTLLRTRTQLLNLLAQVDGESEASQTGPGSQTVSDALRKSAQERLGAVDEALEEEDFAEKTLSEKCHIPSKNRVSSTKSRQAVIARPPKCLVVHINRSMFDEMTGMLRKNYAAVKFPTTMDLSEWCLGGVSQDPAHRDIEQWGTDPRVSMLSRGRGDDSSSRFYELRAVVTHYGRHENGHYICYRKYPTEVFPAHVPEAVLEADGDKEKSERWYRLSDEDVQMVSEASVLSQGGAFMLFYEAVEPSSSWKADSDELASQAGDISHSSISSRRPSDSVSATSATGDSVSDVSQAPSVAASLPVDLHNEKPPLGLKVDL